ncbi:unnamed protein product, partial [Ectocarpus sp. 12 AP-2014]
LSPCRLFLSLCVHLSVHALFVSSILSTPIDVVHHTGTAKATGAAAAMARHGGCQGRCHRRHEGDDQDATLDAVAAAPPPAKREHS